MLILLVLAGVITLAVMGGEQFMHGHMLPALVAGACVAAFLVAAPIAWWLGDLFRRFAMPSLVFGSGAMDLAGQRLFWMVGPQSLGVGLAFIACVGVARAFEGTNLASAAAQAATPALSATTVAAASATDGGPSASAADLQATSAGAASEGVASVAEFPPEPNPQQYPPRRFAGPVVTPDFSDHSKPWTAFRSRITAAVQAGSNFAGDAAIAEFGCGTNCMRGYIINLQTGQVIDLPKEGEDFYNLTYRYDVGSTLLRTQWESQPDQAQTTCYRAYFQWTGSSFLEADKRSAPGACPEG
ncbi:hypothetical protein ACO2Q3_12465 [Caulobacter sp. KR2-114]|uniref:hypothetical protein n=1 Tax=Caulobacter sp. KR2-114 TaxID=3400912 RepID=UPI003BFAA8DC